jgi:zinc/manganese transport system substrate-binding protein
MRIVIFDRMTRTILILVVTAALLAVSGVAAVSAARSIAAGGSRLQVVAAENVYGDIARQIGGSSVTVTSILSDPNADPHLYEPGTANGLAVSEARVAIQNGLGYDAFMNRLEAAAPNSHRLTVTIADALGVHGADANPHLWYDVPRLDTIAAAIAGALERADPGRAGAYRAGLARFDASLAPLRREVASIRRADAGRRVAYTEPVPGYLLGAAGLRNVAPSSFTRAIEDGTEPSPSAVAAMTALATTKRISVLLYNDQTVSPLTERIRAAARSAGVPVVGVSETLPPHLTFQDWQLGQAQAIARALAR